MMKEDWTSRLRERLEGHETPTPEGLWHQIEQALPKKSKARKITLQRWISIAAAILFVCGVGLSLLWKGDSTVGNTADIGSISQDNSANRRAENSSDVYSETGVSNDFMAQAKTNGNEQISFSVGNKNYILQTEVVDGEPVMLSVRVEDKISESKEVAEHATTERLPQGEKQRVVRHNGYSVMPKSFETTPRFRHRFTASLSASSLAMMDRKSNNGVLMNPTLLGGFGYNGNTTIDGNLLVPRLFLADYEERTEHKAPLTIGVRLGYDITPRMWVESGLQYSKLSSTFVRDIRGSEIKSEQALHYVGVPVSVGYRLLDVGRLSFYGVAGAQADFNVKSKNSVEGVEGDVVKDNMQFSANAALGAQFKVAPNLGIYVEPGARYYFDNGSNVMNYFKDKKLNFNLQVGARWNIGNK